MEDQNNIEVSCENYDIKGHGILGGSVVSMEAWPKESKQKCEVTGARVRYLFVIENSNGETLRVKAGVIQAKGATQNQVDRAYNLHYTKENGGGSVRVTKEETLAALDTFLS